jgi:hypothetical protein
VYGVVRAWRRTLTPGDLLLAGAFPLYALFTGNGMNLTTGDNAATRVLPSVLLTHGTVDLSKTPPFDGLNLPYAGVRIRGRVLNVFPSGTAFVALPHAAIALLGSGGRVTPELVSRWDKHASALLSVAAVCFLFLALRRWGDAEALGASAIFALASPLQPGAAQSLWSATGETFALCVALWLLLRRHTFPATAGLALAAAFACRPTAVVPTLTVLAVLAGTDRRSLLRCAAAFAGGAALVVGVQLGLYGHPLGAYGSLNTAGAAFNTHVASSFVGVLASPSRGLLVFCPWVLLVPFGLRSAWKTDRTLFGWIAASLAATLGIVLLASVHVMWWGGWSLGPRLTTEAAPFLALACIPLVRTRTPIRPALLALVAFAAVTQFLLAYNPAASEWNGQVFDRVGLRSLWYWERGQLAAAWGASVHVNGAPATTRGGDDLWGSVDEPTEEEAVSGRLRVRGWARITGTDLPVTVYIDDEARTPVSASRVARPDVCSAIPSLGDCESAGYEVGFDFRAGDSGLHEIVAVFRAPDGRVRRYPARPFVWRRD